MRCGANDRLEIWCFFLLGKSFSPMYCVPNMLVSEHIYKFTKPMKINIHEFRHLRDVPQVSAARPHRHMSRFLVCIAQAVRIQGKHPEAFGGKYMKQPHMENPQ